MSASESNQDNLFQESDAAETEMGYDEGGLPIYIAALWVTFLVTYVIYMVYYALGDISAWSQL